MEVSSRAVAAVLDRLEAQSIECHSIMVVRHGHVVAEGWWAPYSAERPHLLYSLTKSFTSVAVGLAIADGLLSLDDRVVDILPDHVPAGVCEQGRRITVHHLLSMTAGHGMDSLDEAWQLEPGDLVKGFLRVPFVEAEGTWHAYDNPCTFILARMVERVTGYGLPELLDDRLFKPMGVDHAEWDRVASGAAFGFHGLHLTTEAVAAFGELLLRGGLWGDRQLVPRECVQLATRRHIETLPSPGRDPERINPDFLCGYGYPNPLPGVLWDCLLPGLEDAGSARDDEILADRLRRLPLAAVPGSAAPFRSGAARIDASAEDSALPDATAVVVVPVDGRWLLQVGSSVNVAVGHGQWRESSPLGRPVVAAGAWQGDRFVADLYVITTPHRVRLVVDAGAGTAVARWSTVPLSSPSLALHLRSPLMTRPDVA
jgi:hypothetical protein